ncbi:MAG: carbohydrate-binding domain-containing protein [Sphaerochaetaceae bacterium]|nr:carbohydrate-binding domain-containing protein [Sphaerochaetaceae bacterium]
MRKSISTVLISVIALLFVLSAAGCNSDVSYVSTSSTSTSSSTYTSATTTRSIATDEESYSAQNWDLTVYVNLEDGTWSTDNSTYSTDDIEDMKISTSDGVVTINCKSYEGDINFILSGTVEDGSLLIKKTGEKNVGLYLNGVSITSGNYPCIEVKGDVVNTFVYLNGTNTLTDGRTYGVGYSDEEGTDYYTSSYSGTPDEDAELTASWAQGSDAKGTLYSRGSLIFSGSGSLSITQNYKHCIASKDYVRIINGTYTLSSTSGRDGIRAVNGFVMDDGTLTINVSGSHTNNESRGIVVEGEDASEDDDGNIVSSSTPGEGFVLIKGGSITINSYSKAITAKWDIDEDALTSSTSDDPFPYVRVTGGTLSITTTGSVIDDEHASSATVTDANGVSATEEVTRSPEGIEGKQAVYIEGGEITISTTDDSINASREDSSEIVFSGGKVYAIASSQDCIDSNGNITISGGFLYIICTSSGNGAFDCDGTLSITGGTLFALYKSSNLVSVPSSSTQGYAVVSASKLASSAGNTGAVKDSSSNVVFAATFPSSISSSSNYKAIISASGLSAGSSYNMYKDVSVSGGSKFEGLYYSMPTVSSSSSSGSFTAE